MPNSLFQFALAWEAIYNRNVIQVRVYPIGPAQAKESASMAIRISLRHILASIANNNDTYAPLILPDIRTGSLQLCDLDLLGDTNIGNQVCF